MPENKYFIYFMQFMIVYDGQVSEVLQTFVIQFDISVEEKNEKRQII